MLEMSHEELKVEFRHVSEVIHYLCSLYRLSSDIDAPEVFVFDCPSFPQQLGFGPESQSLQILTRSKDLTQRVRACRGKWPPRNEAFSPKVDGS